MKKALLTLSLILLSLQGFAQQEVKSLTFIPRIGINLANINGEEIAYGINEETVKLKSRLGVMAGIEAEYQLSKPFSLSAGAFYSLQGGKYDDMEDYRNWSVALHYVNVPIMAHLYLFKGFALQAGVQPGYAFFKKEYQDQLLDNTWKSFTMSATSYGNFDFSIPVGLSYDFNRIRIDARYNFGLVDINKSILMDKKYNRVMQFSIGYKL